MSPELLWLDSLQGSGIRPGLSRMRTILRAASNPQRQIPSVLVAGTNGKGSVAATLAAIMKAAGIRTALYTSPHLVSIRERWRIDGTDIKAPALREAIRELRSVSERAGIRPTYFEALTLIAFLAFRTAKCQLMILEVGMGGRLDATNVVRPLLSLITSIGLDHREYLGDTIEEIAAEKGGIIHRGSTALSSVRREEAREVIAGRARAVKATFRSVADDTIVRRRVGRNLEVITPNDSYEIQSPLRGRHQHDNLALAIAAAEELRRWFTIPRAAIREGAERVRWSARLEEFEIDGRRVIVDGAHNLEGVEALVTYLREEYPEGADLIFAAMKDKPCTEMLQALAPVVGEVWLTCADAVRGAAPETLLKIARRSELRATVAKSPRIALRRALGSLTGRPLLIAGSLYLAGEVLPVLRRAAAASEKASRTQLTAQESAMSPARLPNRRTSS